MFPLRFLADDLRAHGLVVVEEPGWKTRGGPFYGPAGEPIGGMQHHTAPPVPYPVTALYGPRIKANYNVKPDGRVHVIAAGACNYSSGPGSRSVRIDTTNDVAPVATARQLGLVDNDGGNAWYVNNETDHAGNGSPIPRPQYDALVTAWVVICRRFGWSANRIVAHAEWTARKIDPYWNGRDAHLNLADIRRDVAATLTNPEEDEPVITHGATGEYVKRVQRRLNRWRHTQDPKPPRLDTDGIYGPATAGNVAAFQQSLDLPATGDVDGITASELRNFMPESLQL